jgi:hypothetical protein
MKSLALFGGLLMAWTPQDQPPGPSAPTQAPGREPAAKKFSELRIFVFDRDHKPVDLTLATGTIVVRPKSGSPKTMNLSIMVPEAPPELPPGATRAAIQGDGDFVIGAVMVPPAGLDRPPADDMKTEKKSPPKAPHAKPEEVKPLPPLTNAYFKADLETPEKDPSFSAEVTILLRDKRTTARFEVPFRTQEKSATEEPSKKVK